MIATSTTLRAAALPLRASRRAGARVGASRRVLAVKAFIESDDVKETTKEVIEKANTTATEYAEKIQAWWEASEDKPTIIAVGSASLLALYFANTIVAAVDHLPLFSTIFELIGLTFSGWTAYNLIFVDGEKEKLISEAKGFASKVGLDL